MYAVADFVPLAGKAKVQNLVNALNLFDKEREENQPCCWLEKSDYYQSITIKMRYI